MQPALSRRRRPRRTGSIFAASKLVVGKIEIEREVVEVDRGSRTWAKKRLVPFNSLESSASGKEKADPPSPIPLSTTTFDEKTILD